MCRPSNKNTVCSLFCAVPTTNVAAGKRAFDNIQKARAKAQDRNTSHSLIGSKKFRFDFFLGLGIGIGIGLGLTGALYRRKSYISTVGHEVTFPAYDFRPVEFPQKSRQVKTGDTTPCKKGDRCFSGTLESKSICDGFTKNIKMTSNMFFL